MPHCVADNARMALVNRVNSVNLSTNLKNPAANTNARGFLPRTRLKCPGSPQATER